MRIFAITLVAILLAGCAGTHPRGTSRFDAYDVARVDQMVGNDVAGVVFEKVIVCLNARRETRTFTALTNVDVSLETNRTVSTLTNLTVTGTTNRFYTMGTNQTVTAAPPAATNEVAATEGEAPVTLVAAPPSATTNQSVAMANNNSVIKGGNQLIASFQSTFTTNNQVSATTNNLTLSYADTQTISLETNQTLTYQTNVVVSSVTNVQITPTNLVQHDYFLWTEVTPPPDFNLAPGESLTLLVDGERYSFAPATPQAAFVSRRGFTSTFYRVPPQVIVAIANAREAKLRIRGSTLTLERTLSDRSRRNFRDFLWTYFSPDPVLQGSGATALRPPNSTPSGAPTVARADAGGL